MIGRNKILLAGYALALTGCGVIALFDRVFIGAIGAGLSTVIFALLFFFPRSAGGPRPTALPARPVTAAYIDQPTPHPDPGLPNSENVALPIYYQIDRQE